MPRTSMNVSSDSENDIDSNEEDSVYRLIENSPIRVYTNYSDSADTLENENESRVADKADFVLVWKNDSNNSDESRKDLRQRFMQAMIEKGLIIKELSDISPSYHFAEVIATPEALKVNALNFQLCLPIEKCSYIKTDDTQRLSVKFDKNALSACTPNHRAVIVNSILNSFYCSDSPRLETLLADGVFFAAFQPHDIEKKNFLRDEWASMKNFLQIFPWQQPLSRIRAYFGDKIGLYFAWLNFYTLFLLVASISSSISFMLGLMIDDPVTKQICNRENTIIMCPLCDHGCSYWTLKKACKKYRFTSFMVNEATLTLNLTMLIITPLFLKLWKRFCASLAHRWNISSFNVKCEVERPQYSAKMRENHTEPVEGVKIAWKILKGTGLAIFFILVIVVVVGGVIYHEHLKTSFSRWGDEGVTSLLSSIVKAVFTYCLIYGLNFIYEYIAEYMTEQQCLRTQTQYDNSLTIQLVAFAFITKYAHIFFVVLVKGNFTGTPKEYNRIFNYRLTECGYGGCLLDLIILLASMKAVYTLLDKPVKKPLKKWIESIEWWRSIQNMTVIYKSVERIPGDHPYIKDTNLQEFTSRDFLNMNLDRVLNFAIVTIFVPVFPLAPMVALIYSLYTTRTDAKELLDGHRRPIFPPARDIGVFYGFLDRIQYIAIVTQGFINAFIYDLVPRFVYRLFYSPNRSLDGYVEFTLSKFNTSDYAPEYLPKTPSLNVTECSYRDYRNDPGTELEYERSVVYWHFLAARMIFFTLFVALGLIIISLVNVCIKDTPKNLRKLQKQRNMYETYNGYYLNST